ncbi:hypothetical protein ACET3Z_010275 [Daucus carota]
MEMIDLKIPLSSWNTRLSKIAKSTKKHARRSASAILAHDYSITNDQTLNFADETTDGSSSSGEQVNVYDMDSSQILQTSDTVLENKETISLAGQQETCVNTFGVLENKEIISILTWKIKKSYALPDV